jgi:hypothetical protein
MDSEMLDMDYYYKYKYYYKSVGQNFDIQST